MRNYNRYRNSQYDKDRYEDRSGRYYDRYSDYDDYDRQSGEYDNSWRGQDFNRRDYNSPQSGSSRYRGFNSPDYQDGQGRSARSQFDYDSGYSQSNRDMNDDYNTSYQNRNYRSGNYENDWNGNWNRRNENVNYYDNKQDYNQDRGWWDKTRDEVSSWFGDDDAKRRRRMDEIRDHKGKGPKNYQRSSERIKEDVNDKLSDDWRLDASNIEVEVSGSEVTLNGTVNDRDDKRRAEDIAENVSGVTHVQNNLRVSKSDEDLSDSDKTNLYSARSRKSEIHHN